MTESWAVGTSSVGGSGGGSNHSAVSVSVPRRLTPREQALSMAQSLIAGHRDKDYGPPIENFARAAGTLTALGYKAPNGGPVQPHDIATIMLAIKLARLAHDPENPDTWIDVAGYAGCGVEVVEDEVRRAKDESNRAGNRTPA